MLRCELHPDSGLVVVDQYDVSLSDGAWHKVTTSELVIITSEKVVVKTHLLSLSPSPQLSLSSHFSG